MKSTLKEKLEKRLGELGASKQEIDGSLDTLVEIVTEWSGNDPADEVPDAENPYTRNWKWFYIFEPIPGFYPLHPGNGIEAVGLKRYLEIISQIHSAEDLNQIIGDFEYLVPLVSRGCRFNPQVSSQFLNALGNAENEIRKGLIDKGEVFLTDSSSIAPYLSSISNMLPVESRLSKGEMTKLRSKLLEFKITLFECLNKSSPVDEVKSVLESFPRYFSNLELGTLQFFDQFNLYSYRERCLYPGGLRSAVIYAIEAAFEIEKEFVHSLTSLITDLPARSTLAPSLTDIRTYQEDEVSRIEAAPRGYEFYLLAKDFGDLKRLESFHGDKMEDYLEALNVIKKNLLNLLPGSSARAGISLSSDGRTIYIDGVAKGISNKAGKLLKAFAEADSGISMKDALGKAGYKDQKGGLASVIKDKAIRDFIENVGGRYKLII